MHNIILLYRFLSGSAVKNTPAMHEITCLIPESGRSPGGGYGNPPQDSFLENPIERCCQATVHRVTKSRTWLKQLSKHTHTSCYAIIKQSSILRRNVLWQWKATQWNLALLVELLSSEYFVFYENNLLNLLSPSTATAAQRLELGLSKEEETAILSPWSKTFIDRPLQHRNWLKDGER